MSNVVTNKVLKKRCKCCLRERSSEDLWSEHYYNGRTEHYGLMLSDCFQLEWNKPEFGMEHICHPCIGRLRDACDFKKQVLDAQRVLAKISGNITPDMQQQVEDLIDNYLHKSSSQAIRNEDMQKRSTNMFVELNSQENYTDVEFLDTELDDIIIKVDDETEGKKNEVTNMVLIGDTLIKKVENDTRRSPESPYADDDITDHYDDYTIDTTATTKEDKTNKQKNQNETNKQKNQNDESKDVFKNLLLNKRKCKLPKHPMTKKHHANISALLLSTNASLIQKWHDKGFKCVLCDTYYMIAADLKTHFIQDHTDQEKVMYQTYRKLCERIYNVDIADLKCNHCSEELEDLEAVWPHLAEHGITVHPDVKNHIIPLKLGVQVYKCFKCSQNFKNFRDLCYHMNIHYPNYICSMCGKGFINKNLLHRHTSYVHENGTFKCTMCPKVFKIRMRWRAHQATHKIKRNRKMCCVCGFCGERFSEGSKKNRHLEAVHGFQRTMFQCDLCGKQLTSRKSITNHIQGIHLQMKRFQCPICNKEFYDQLTTTRHIEKSHSNELKCKICGKRFKREASYKMHMQVHAGKRYECKLCSETFILKTGLESHLKLKHNNVDQNIDDDALWFLN